MGTISLKSQSVRLGQRFVTSMQPPFRAAIQGEGRVKGALTESKAHHYARTRPAGRTALEMGSLQCTHSASVLATEEAGPLVEKLQRAVASLPQILLR